MKSTDSENISFLCFGGGDWSYHNHSHIDMQMLRRFARIGTALYVNAIVMQKPNLKKNIGGGKSFTHKLVRKTKSILRGLRESGVGFWVYSPISLPVQHITWLKPVNEAIVQRQVLTAMNRLKMENPL